MTLAKRIEQAEQAAQAHQSAADLSTDEKATYRRFFAELRAFHRGRVSPEKCSFLARRKVALSLLEEAE